jgi:XTP/dITP diphosphohydrolase
MEKEIIFATSNQDKAREIEKILKAWKVLSLKDLEFYEDIPEEQDSLEGNAQQKAQYVWDRFKIPCFADDTGLEVKVLNGRPGVYSARYAGPNCSYEDNVNKMLFEMKGKKNRDARFRTSICLILSESTKYFFDGICSGEILSEVRGEGGFGYDPIFLPKGESLSFAEMSLERKNAISHRGRAVAKLSQFLEAMD